MSTPGLGGSGRYLPEAEHTARHTKGVSCCHPAAQEAPGGARRQQAPLAVGEGWGEGPPRMPSGAAGRAAQPHAAPRASQVPLGHRSEWRRAGGKRGSPFRPVLSDTHPDSCGKQGSECRFLQACAILPPGQAPSLTCGGHPGWALRCSLKSLHSPHVSLMLPTAPPSPSHPLPLRSPCCPMPPCCPSGCHAAPCHPPVPQSSHWPSGHPAAPCHHAAPCHPTALRSARGRGLGAQPAAQRYG